MFQSYALFPHLTVEGNVAFGLKQDGLPQARDRGARRARCWRWSSSKASAAQAAPALRRPAPARRARALAGQAAARAAARRAAGGARQEAARRDAVRADAAARSELGLTFVIVTHDQEEAMTVADRIGVMDRGRLMQVATPRRNLRAAELALGRRLHRRREPDRGPRRRGRRRRDRRSTSAAAGRLRAATGADAKPGDTVWVALRPEKVRIAPARRRRDGELRRRRGARHRLSRRPLDLQGAARQRLRR